MASSALQIPDLRFEKSFMRSLHANSVKKHHKLTVAETNEEAKTQLDPLPVAITPAIVIYTVVKDQILMPFVQGFAMTSVLLLFKPIIYKIFENGRDFGTKLYNRLGSPGYRGNRASWTKLNNNTNPSI